MPDFVPVRERFTLPVQYLFVQSTFMNFAFFMLIPMLSIHYLSLGMTALFVGNLYAVRILSQQGLQLFGGAVADRLPYRYVILMGCVIRALGFAMFAVLPASHWIYAAAILFGIGGALFGPASNAVMVSLVPAHRRPRAFTIQQAASNIGTTVGPVVGAFLVYQHFMAICWISGSIFVMLGIMGVILLPPQSASPIKPNFWAGVSSIKRNRTFLSFVGLFMGYYFIYQQLYIAIPDVLTTLHANKSALGELFSLEAIIEIAASYPMVAFISRYAHIWTPPRLMSVGMFVMGIGLVPLAFHVGLFSILTTVIAISLGSVIALPNRQTYTAALAEPTYLASYFGVSSISMAIGASAGASGGGFLMHAFQTAVGPIAVPAVIVFVLIALCCGALFLKLPVPGRASARDAVVNV